MSERDYMHPYKEVDVLLVLPDRKFVPFTTTQIELSRLAAETMVALKEGKRPMYRMHNDANGHMLYATDILLTWWKNPNAYK